ncbi:hypothetical protein G3I22_26515 [Actinospica acidiphila]|nr:hypothetical protein [Actinospica acidiphila]
MISWKSLRYDSSAVPHLEHPGPEMTDEALVLHQECRRERSYMREKKGWRTFRSGCVIVAGVMTATYWTLRTVQAGIDLYGAVGPWV